MIDRDAPALIDAAEALDGVLPVICDVSKPDEVDEMVGPWSPRSAGSTRW